MKRNVFALLLVISILIAFGCSSDSKSLKLSPSKLDFEKVFIGDAETISMTMTNKYGKPIEISTIALSGSTDFTISNNISTPLNMDKNEEVIVEIKFEPGTAGILEAIMTISHDGSTKPKEVKCYGEGVAVPRIELNDMSYDFGVVYVNLKKSHDFIVKNIGTSLLTVSSVSVNGASTNLYSITAGAAPFQIAPGADHTFTLEFGPTADGKFPVSLIVVHDAVNEPSTITIPIDGEGVTFAPEIKFGETSPWDIGTFSNAAPSIHDLVITSDGVDPLTISSASFVTGTAFSVSEFQDKNANVVNLPQTIQPGDTLTIKIEFAPTANQVYNDTLSIGHDAINEVTPYDFSIEGTGRDPIVKTFSYTGAIENWSVPAGISKLTIEAWGAQGGNPNNQGGKGAYIKGDVTVTPGDTLKILVGERGKNGSGYPTYDGGGGGGGSFVCKSNNDPLIIAGGGGGYCSYNSATTHDGRSTTDGGDTYNNGGGNSGQGGQSGITNGQASGGGGLLTAGGNGSSGTGGSSFLNGGNGGSGYGSGSYTGGDGGFGGGGGGWHNSINRSGGGGGYSGGQGGTCSGQASGGGGGSINNGSNKTDTPGVQSGNGEIKITY